MAGFFGFLDFTKEGPGIEKDAPKKKAPFVFIETFFRNFWRFMLINVVYTVLSIPVVTHGMTSAGFTNVARNIARDKHSFGLSDFFETIKKNLKQSIIVGIINAIITAIVAFALYIYYVSYTHPETESLFNLIGFGASIAFAAVFAMMQFYIYTLMITFDFSIKKLYSNSFKFVFLNLWKNLLCGAILLATIAIYVLVFIAFDGNFRVLFIELLIALLTYPAFRFLLIQFFTFGSIKKYIIDPYYKEHPDADIEKRRDLGLEVPEEDDNEEEPISWE
ncbi:MAG: DUF624 domain-containing protein [Clostridia bacterium]|nr:DUF624 domain-containing protein [Clostridia bacterium]